MEDNVVVGESNCKRSDLTPVAKFGVPLIESQPSNVDNAAENYKGDECRHFSIRGYVSEVRRKDSKICWPFPTVGDLDKLEEQMLPPLHVPKFRWWKCQNCLRKNDAKDTPIETGVVKNCCKRVCETKTSTSPGIPSTLSCGDAQNLHSGFQESSEVNIVDARKSSLEVFLQVDDDEHWPALFGNKKEKEAEVVDTIMEDIHKLTDSVARENMNLEICRSTSLEKFDSCHAGVNFTTGSTFSTDFPIGKKGCDISFSGTAINIPSKLKGYDLIMSSSEISHKETEALKSKSDELINSSKEIFHTEMPAFSRNNLSHVNEGHRDGVTSSVISEVDKETLNAVMCQTKKIHYLVSIDNSSEDENLAEEEVHDQDHTNWQANSGDTSHGSKPRKLRSLTDIIRREMLATSNELHYTERDTKTDHMKTQVSQSKATPEASPGTSLYPITNNQVAFQGTDKKGMLGKKKKCKLPRDQDQGSSRMSWQRGATENIKILKEDSAIKSMDAINANCELTGNASFLPNLHFSSKNSLVKHRNDKKLILDREKKVFQVEDSSSSLAHHQDGLSGQVEIRKDAEIELVGSELIPIKFFKDASGRTDQNPRSQIYVAAQQKGKNLSIDKKKNKVPQVEGEKPPIMPWQEGMSRKDLIIKRYLDRKHKVAPSDSLNSARVPFTGKGVHGGLKHHMQTHKKATLNKSQKNLPQEVDCRVTIAGSESVSSPLPCQPKDSSNPCNCQNSADVKEPSKLSLDQCDQVANKMCGQEASDDIPMEIVELMARNQYERHLYYAKNSTENRYCLSETIEKDEDTGLMDCTEALGNEMLRLPHERSNLQASPSYNAKNGIDSDPSGGFTKQKSDVCLPTVDGEYYSINSSGSQLKQAQASTSKFIAFPECQGNLPGQVPYPDIGSRVSCGTENCDWDRDMVGHRVLGSSVQSLGAYHTQAILQRSSIVESQSVWSTVPYRIPFELNCPQKFITGVGISNRFSHSPDPLPKGNVNGDHTQKPLNLKATHLQKKKGISEMETDKGPHPEYLFACPDEGNVYHPKLRGSLDLYNDETLSAMHLLRLMHAGVCSSTPVNMSNNRDMFLKDPQFAHAQFINKSPGPEASVSKTNGDLVNLSSCDYHSRSHHRGKSCEHFPPVSIPKSVDSLVQKDVRFERANVFTNGLLGKAFPGALNYQERGDENISYTPAQTRSPKLQTTASRNGCTSENQEYMIHNPQKGFLLLPASDSRQFPEQPQTAGGSTKHVELKVNRKDETVSPVETISGFQICTLNRNPADFTLPSAANVYMIGAEDLKRKLTPSMGRRGPIDFDLNKRPKKMKRTMIEHRQI